MSGAPSPYLIAPLAANLDRSEFSSGSEPLDTYLLRQVTQDVRRRVTACFVALTPEQQIAGYYTLASASILLGDLPEDIGKRLPRYPAVPAVLLGRLAVDKRHRGRGLGGALVADALARCARSEIAAFALIADAKDEPAAAFYRHHGFIPLPNAPLRLFLPLGTARIAERRSR